MVSLVSSRLVLFFLARERELERNSSFLLLFLLLSLVYPCFGGSVTLMMSKGRRSSALYKKRNGVEEDGHHCTRVVNEAQSKEVGHSTARSSVSPCGAQLVHSTRVE